MSLTVDGTTISLFQGDSGEITFTGLTEGAVVYLSVRDKRSILMFDELREIVDHEGEVTFKITPEDSDKLIVKVNEDFAIYYYGIKQVNEETEEEDTVFLGESTKYTDKYMIKVYPKKVEGL